MSSTEAPFGGTPELCESYEACARETRRFWLPLWTAGEVLPAAVRPHLRAVHGFAVRTDRIADEGAPAERAGRIARWRADTLAEVRSGRSDHPLRRAFVDTVRRWDLDRAVLAEFLDAIQADCVRPPPSTPSRTSGATCGGLGDGLRVVDPAAGARGPEASRLASLLGEAGQLADIFEDLPIDLAAGRCYLPGSDLRRLGLDVADLRRGEPREALDALVGVQLDRWRELLEQAAPAAGMVAPANQPFLHTLLLGAQLHFDEVTLLRARVLVDGLEPLTPTGTARRQAPRELGPVPDHVAVIMDGNRRWAELRGLSAVEGHHAGERAAMRLVNAALRLGIRHLSVYAFSTENWDRSGEELAALFDSMADGITRGVEWLHELGVRVRWCGRRDRIDPSLAAALAVVESMTSDNDVLSLTLCLDYGGRDELVTAPARWPPRRPRDAPARGHRPGRHRPEPVRARSAGRRPADPHLR